MATSYKHYFPHLPTTALWIKYKSLDAGMTVENEHTIRVARFTTSSYNSQEAWRNSPFNPNPRSVAICANRATR